MSGTDAKIGNMFRRAAVAVMAALACGALAQPLSVRDDRGTEHHFEVAPRRIVTMLPSLSETAWVLGAGSRLVGVDRYSSWPSEVAKLPHLGGLEDAQIEAIAALKPDVVLASTSSRAMDRLEALGFAVVRLRSESHDDVRRTLDLVGRLLGTPERATRTWLRLNQEIEAAAARVPRSMRGQRVYFEIGGGPYAAGTASFIGETLARMGMGNIVPPELGPFPKLNPEYVVRAKPDLIMGAQRDQSAVTSRPGWQTMPAVQRKHLCGFNTSDYDMMVRPGPRMGEAASLLADCLVRLSQETVR